MKKSLLSSVLLVSLTLLLICLSFTPARAYRLHIDPGWQTEKLNPYTEAALIAPAIPVIFQKQALQSGQRFIFTRVHRTRERSRPVFPAVTAKTNFILQSRFYG